jgi:hypothetical protein
MADSQVGSNSVGDMTPAGGTSNPILRWVDRNILSIGREMRLSYLPPLMV